MLTIATVDDPGPEPRAPARGSARGGTARIFVDHGTSSRRADRLACLDYLRAGDTLVVWRLDRLAGGCPRVVVFTNGRLSSTSQWTADARRPALRRV